MYQVAIYILVFYWSAIRLNANFGCPPAPTKCDLSYGYRRIDEMCNNLINPTWGASFIAFKRSLPAEYDTGDSPRGSSGSPNLPSPRNVSIGMTNSATSEVSTSLTLLAMTLGQILAHDISLTRDVSLDLPCCTSDQKFLPNPDPECAPLNVKYDPFYHPLGIECLNLSRSIPASPLCGLGYREQVNSHTAFINLSPIYGNSEEESDSLRTFFNGQLKVDELIEDPPGTTGCPVPMSKSSCPFIMLPQETVNGKDKLLSGDTTRTDENPALLSLHAVFNRLHNGLALRFATKYSLSDEEAFQQARRYAIAVYQHIIYTEYLPTILDLVTLQEHRIDPDASYLYDAFLDPSVTSEFATSAFRFGHTQIQDNFFLSTGTVLLKNSYFIPDITYHHDRYPSIFIEGIIEQPGGSIDEFVVAGATNFLRAKPPNLFGSDLFGRNVLRQRDHGQPSYMAWRTFCGLPTFSNYQQLTDLNIMKPSAVEALKKLYPNVDDIELYPAGLAEIPVVEDLLGPTFACLIAKQFKKLKFGDRFFYQAKLQPKPFSTAQLIAIGKTTLAAVLCYTTNIQQIQRFALKIPRFTFMNSVLPCNAHLAGTIFEHENLV